MVWLFGWDVLGRMAVAMLVGALIGVEREVRDHPAGLRTHTTVALGAAVFGVISTTGFDAALGRGSSIQCCVRPTPGGSAGNQTTGGRDA